MLCKKWRELNAWRDNTRHDMDVFKKSDSDYNCPKIHLKSHWVDLNHRYRALQPYSAKRHELEHKMNHKNGWDASNHDLNYLAQLLMFQHRILCVGSRELNPKTLAQCWENSAAPCKVLPSSAGLATQQSSQSYAEPKFMGPLNRGHG